jgi:ubiquinone/menaquinone biosynthesis C-methylase UbiE
MTMETAVREAYSAAAERPWDVHPFPVGRKFAESLGYRAEVLDSLPSIAVEAFAGVSNVSIFARLPAGSRVLDLGCGAGLASLIAARRVGVGGLVVGLDFSAPMLARARRSVRETDIGNIVFCLADAARLPLRDESVDVALVNGIFNLNPSRSSIFKELARTVRPGGAVFAAELVVREPLPPEVRASERSWFA